jgi:D-amino-acid dehydrogenase
MEVAAKEMDCDVVIIGAGLIGLSAADSLLRRGASVMIAEIKPSPMCGTSAQNSGMVHPSQALPWAELELCADARRAAAEAVFELAQKSAAIIEARAKSLSLPQAARARGCLQIFETHAALRAARSIWMIWTLIRFWRGPKACRCPKPRARGCLQIFETHAALRAAKAGYEALGADCRQAVAKDFGRAKAFGGRPALFFAQDSSGNARDYGLALADDLAARGAVFHTGQGAMIWKDGGRAIGVRLGNKDIRAAHTVLAAGPQSREIAARAGLDLPLSTLTGWAVNFKTPQGVALPNYPVMDAQSRSALTVFGDVLRLSGTAGEADAAPLLARWEALMPDIFAALGDQLPSPLAPPRRAERPISMTGAPLIGRSHVPGLWVNTGHGHMGWTLCAGSGELLAGLMEGAPSDPRFAVKTA